MMSLTKKRWVVLAASCLINLCIGSLYAWSVFASPMAEYLSKVTESKITSLTIVFTIANVVGPITMITGGFINDKIGPKWVIFAGGLLFGTGMIMSGFSKSVGMLIVSYGLCVGLAVGMVYGCTIANSVKFFPDKRGLAGGIATASYGISSVLVPLIANVLISHLGVTVAFKFLGAAMMLIICIAACFITTCPKGFVPEGYLIQENLGSVTSGKNWEGMLKDPVFYVMLLMLCCGAFSGLMITSQASPIAQNMIRMSVTEAATAVSVLALFNTGGRILAGYASDKIGAINTLRAIFLIAICGSLTLYFCKAESTALFYIGLCIVGLSFGSTMGIFPGFTAVQFGAQHNSVNYGIMFIGFALAGFFGPTIMSKVYSNNGAYQGAFIIAVVIAAAGFALSFVYKWAKRKKQVVEN